MAAFNSDSNMTHHKGGKAASHTRGGHLGHVGGRDPHAHPSHHAMNKAHGTPGAFDGGTTQGGGAPVQPTADDFDDHCEEMC